MSTNAQSAQKWLLEQKPSIEKIQQVITKLTSRLEAIDHNHPAWEGSLAALELLQAEIDTHAAASLASVDESSLDYSALVDYSQTDSVTLSEHEKKRRFIELKKQYNTLEK